MKRRSKRAISNLGNLMKDTGRNYRNYEFNPCVVGWDFPKDAIIGNLVNPSFDNTSFFSCLSLIRNTISSMPIEAYIENNDGIKETLRNHPVVDIFYNNFLSKTTLLSKLVDDVVLKGQSFFYIERNSKGYVEKLRYLNDCSVLYNSQDNTLFYKSPQVGLEVIEPINILHFYLYSSDGVNGISLPRFSNRLLRLCNASEKQAEDFFSNGCNAAGFIKSSKNLSDKQKDEISASFSVASRSLSKRTPVFSADLDYVKLSMNAADSQLLETRKYNAVDICKLFNIPPVFIGEQGGATYSTPENEQQFFLNNCIMPWVNMIESELNRKLTFNYQNLVISLNEDSLLRSDKRTQAEFYTKLVTNGILSINEAREELGYQSIGEEGDKHIIPFTDLNKNSIEDNGKNREGNSENDR